MVRDDGLLNYFHSLDFSRLTHPISFEFINKKLSKREMISRIILGR